MLMISRKVKTKKGNKMKYSIIVPIYKIDAYIHECVQSVLKQEYTLWELILVDDGSPDCCPAICDEYARKDNRIKVVHKENGGLVSARKAGIEVATGDYAICLDGDDYLHESCLARINGQVQRYLPDVICHGYVKKYSNRHIEVPFLRYHPGYYARNAIEKEILPRLLYTKDGYYFPRMVWSKAYKMDIYRKYQMAVSSNISMGEDGACTYPIICHANSMVIIPECLYYYRQIETSMTKVKKPLKWDNYDKLYEHYKNMIALDQYELREQMYRARTHNLFNICMSQFYAGKGYSETISEIRERFKNHGDYDVALDGASFTSLRLLFCKYVLKYRLFRILKCYSNYKYNLK